MQITVGNEEVRTMFLLVKNNLQKALLSVLAAVEAIVSDLFPEVWQGQQ